MKTDPLKRPTHDPVILGCKVFAGLAVVLAVAMGIPAYFKARQVAQDSAHSALWHEINQQLKEREATGKLPASLEELPLTYPDNGSPEMLKLIVYRREGAGCTVSTTLRGETLECRYGEPESTDGGRLAEPDLRSPGPAVD